MLIGIRGRKKVFDFFNYVRRVFIFSRPSANLMHQTVFLNSTGNTLFRTSFDFRPHVSIYGPKTK